jgi:hypothetical protein
MKKITLILAAGIILFTACKKNTDDEVEPTEPETETESGSFKVGGTTFTDSNPYLGIFNNNGSINNTLRVTGSNGAKVEFHFTGSSPATYTLASYSAGYYTNSAGKQYNSTRGQLVVTAYSTSGTTRKVTGTFNFWAKAIVTPYDSVEVTSGVLTNVSN